MKRDKAFYRDKTLLAMQRERKALWKRMAQTVAIDPPIPRGWVRHWRLTTNAACRHDAPILRIMLTKIDNPRFHWRRSFQYGKRRQRRMIENTQGLCGIRESKWASSGWPEAWKKYFRQVLINPGK